ncbi:hypothetical protein BJ546DRAFT_1064216 [Cryomyces antarcticus]
MACSKVIHLFTILLGLAIIRVHGHISRSYPKHAYHARNLNTIQSIYNRTVYPTNLVFLANGSASVPAGLFNENATGRITPVGNFSGFEDSVEYFFALAPAARPPTYAAFVKAEIVEFVSECPEVAASTVYFRTQSVHPGAPDDGRYITTLKQIAFWRFDSTGAVQYYDAWIPSLNLFTAKITNATILTPAYEAAAIQSLCGATQALCTGGNTQYASIGDCVATLSARAFGEYDEIWGDNVVCRTIHVLLARIRPDVHCPHVGPTGGGKCVDADYNDVYFDDQALFGQPEGETFVCPSGTLDRERRL